MPDVIVSFYTCDTLSDITGYNGKTPGDLFFAKTDKKIYRWNGTTLEDYGSTTTSSVTEIEIKETAGDPITAGEAGKVYLNTVDKTVKVYRNSQYVMVANFKELASSVADAGSTSGNKVPSETAVRTAIDGAINGLLEGGKIKSTLIPYYAISEFKGAVASKTGVSDSLTSLTTAEVGDFAAVTTGNDAGIYILTGADPTTASNWTFVAPYNYSLPTASSVVKGGIKVGTNLSIDNEVLSANLVWHEITSGN